MEHIAVTADRDAPGARRRGGALRAGWFLWFCCAVLALPTLATLAREVWSTEQGAHGPIVLATGLWLILRLRGRMAAAAQPGSPVITGIVLAVALAIYVLARITSQVLFEGLAIEAAFIALFYYHVGARALARLWFPLGYLLFVLPVPYFVVAWLTQVLKLAIAQASVDLLAAMGYQVANSGVTVFIDQYEILVATACSGLNSLIGLSAIGLFYVYMRHGDSVRDALPLIPLVPLYAVAANFIRVVTLLLVTHYFGAEFMESFVHDTAGIFMFAVAVLLLIASDTAIDTVRGLARRRA